MATSVPDRLPLKIQVEIFNFIISKICDIQSFENRNPPLNKRGGGGSTQVTSEEEKIGKKFKKLKEYIQ